VAKKKPRSAKQKANDKRLGLMAKRRARKSTTKRPKRRKTTTTKRKPNKARGRKKSVVKRRKAPSKRSFTSKIPLINNPTIKKAAVGVGMATIVSGVLSAVLPQFANNPIVKPAAAFVAGGIPGVIAQVVVSGGIPQISGLLGGGGSSSNGNTNTGGNGFA